MNDEIKEIDITKDLYLCSPLLNTKCSKTSCYINNGPCCHTINNEYSQEHLLDYITNLQKTNKNHSKKLIELGDKITNLQQENERLKENNQNMQEEMCRCWQRIDQLTNNWNELEEWLKSVVEYETLHKGNYMTIRGEWGQEVLDKMKEIKENNENS